MRTLPLIGWTVPVAALELAVIAAAALGVALVATAFRMWADRRAELARDELAWLELAGDGWDDDDQAAALAIAAEHQWRQDMAEIAADARSIDAWLAARCPAAAEPYALTVAGARYRARLVLVA